MANTVQQGCYKPTLKIRFPNHHQNETRWSTTQFKNKLTPAWESKLLTDPKKIGSLSDLNIIPAIQNTSFYIRFMRAAEQYQLQLDYKNKLVTALAALDLHNWNSSAATFPFLVTDTNCQAETRHLRKKITDQGPVP